MFFLSIHTIHITNLKKKNSETFFIQLMHTFCFIFQSFKKLLTTEFHAAYDQYLEVTESPAVYTWFGILSSSAPISNLIPQNWAALTV